MRVLIPLCVGKMDPIFIRTTCLNILKMIETPIMIIQFQEESQTNAIRDLIESRPKTIYIHKKEERGNMFDVLIQNYKYARELGINFDYVLFHLMTSYFVKPGVEKYMSQYDAGLGYYEYGNINRPQELEKIGFNDVKKDTEIMKWFLKRNCIHIYKAQLEGTFFKKKVMDKILDILDTEFPNYYKWGAYWKRWGPTMTRFWVSEIVLSTIIFNNMIHDIKIGDPVTWFNFRDFYSTNYCVDYDTFTNILNSNFQPIERNNIMRTCENTFAVKRIPNDQNDKMFNYVYTNLA